MEHDPSLTPAYLARQVDKFVKQQARDTIVRNASRDANARYARVPAPGACDFCRMLGSRGFVYHSEAKAGARKRDGEKYHGFCNCQIAVCFDPFIEKYDVFSEGGTVVTVTRGYGDGRVAVPGRDGSYALRPVDFDELYDEYKAAGKDYNKRARYRDYGKRARLPDEQFDLEMQRLSDASSLDELHAEGERIAREWQKGGRKPDPDQWREMSRHARELEKQLQGADEEKKGRWDSDRKKKRRENHERAIKAQRAVFIPDDEKNARLLRNIKRIKPDPGRYDVHAHGAPKVIDCYDTPMEAKDLAHILSQRKDYHGEPIRLFSCRAGQADDDGDCFAKQLADILGVVVLAAPDVTRILPDGTFYFGTPDITEFKQFEPGGKK